MAKAKSKNIPDGRAKNGGPRKNSGRPIDAGKKLVRYKAQELVDQHESPMDIMVDNMLFWYKASKTIEEAIINVVQSGIKDAADQTEFLSLLKKFLQARENSQRCAVDAAPYVHPRLATIQLKGDINTNVKHVLGDMTPQEAAEAYGTLLRKPQPVSTSTDGDDR